eukprot:4715406-Pleurochrysis_carterae.AAC.2
MCSRCLAYHTHTTHTGSADGKHARWVLRTALPRTPRARQRCSFYTLRTIRLSLNVRLAAAPEPAVARALALVVAVALARAAARLGRGRGARALEHRTVPAGGEGLPRRRRAQQHKSRVERAADRVADALLRVHAGRHVVRRHRHVRVAQRAARDVAFERC